MSASNLVPPQKAPSWKFSASEILSAAENYIKAATELEDKIASQFETASIETVLKPYAFFESSHSSLINQLTFYQHVSTDKELRDASNNADQKIKDFSIESSLREDVFKVFHKLYKEHADSEELNHETKKYLKKIEENYRNNGLVLPLEERNKVKEIQKKLSSLSLKFSKNLDENTEFILFTKEELDGIPKDVLEQFEKVDIDNIQKLKVTFKYPDLVPTLRYAKNPQTRKVLFIAYENKDPENEEFLIEAINLRTELAKALGYKNFADYVLEKRMAKNSETVINFLNDLRKKLTPLGKKERDRLIQLKKSDMEARGLNFDGKFYAWDDGYYYNLLLEKEYQVDRQKIAEYFPMKSTIKKMLELFEILLKLKFVEATKEEYSTWHEDVKQFAVWKTDKPESPEFVGWIYFDLHPRDGKYGHAANFGLLPGYTKEDGSRSYPVTALVCNFSKSTKEKPSLLKHGEVTTFFHELGHGIHDILSHTQYAKFHGPSAVSWDFVEAPSQMLEYWTWSKNELKQLSSHYETGESIPDDLIDSLIRTKYVNSGLFNLRQLHFAIFDITLHTNNTVVDITKFWNELSEEIANIITGDIVTKGFNSFGHIMGGYEAGYFGYLWSKVFAADIYHTKFEADPLNPEIGVQYRDIILARGGTRDENENLKELLGREPNNEAFSIELGLVA